MKNTPLTIADIPQKHYYIQCKNTAQRAACIEQLKATGREHYLMMDIPDGDNDLLISVMVTSFMCMMFPSDANKVTYKAGELLGEKEPSATLF